MEERDRQIRVIEALLFSAKTPLSVEMISKHVPEVENVADLLGDLVAYYSERGINLVNVGGGWAFRTAPELAPVLRREAEVMRKLSRAGLETLAIVAYHQPVTRAEIEQIRGVTVSKGTLDILFDMGWIAPRGRRRTPGRPVTWVTTDVFLEHFGLAEIEELPGVEELRAAGLLDSSAPPLIIAESVQDFADEDEDEEDAGLELELGEEEE